MKRFLLSQLVICSALFLPACQHSEKSETAFFKNFNLGATVQPLKAMPLQPKSGGGGSTTAIGETTDYRRSFELEYMLNEGNREQFDESVFLNELKSEVARQINDAGVRTNGTGSSNDGFYFNYSTDENRGWVEIVGARVEGNRYKLWCVIRESAGIKSGK